MFLLSMMIGCEGPNVEIYSCEDTGYWDSGTDGVPPLEEQDTDHVVYEGPYVELPSEAPLTCNVGEPSTCADPLPDGSWVSMYAETRYACDSSASYGASLGAFQVSHVGDEAALVPAILVGTSIAVSASDYAEWSGEAAWGSTLDLTVGADGVAASELDLAALLHQLGDPDVQHSIDGVSIVADSDCLRIDLQGHICDQCGGTCAFTTSIWLSSLDAVSGYGVVTGPR